MPKGLITSDPSVMMGKPVVSGTRITVELILEKLAAGGVSSRFSLRTRTSRKRPSGLHSHLPLRRLKRTSSIRPRSYSVTFLADESIDPQIVEAARGDGYTVLSIAESAPGMRIKKSLGARTRWERFC